MIQFHKLLLTKLLLHIIKCYEYQISFIHIWKKTRLSKAGTVVIQIKKEKSLLRNLTQSMR